MAGDLKVARGAVLVIRSSDLARYDDIEQERDSVLVVVPDETDPSTYAEIVSAAKARA